MLFFDFFPLRIEKTGVFALMCIICGCFLLPTFSSSEEIKINPTFWLREEYIDNLYYSSKNEEEAFLHTAAAGITAEKNSERLGLDISTRIEHRRTNEEITYDNTDYFCKGGVKYNFTSKTRFSGMYSYIEDSRMDRDYETSGDIPIYTHEGFKKYTHNGDMALSHSLNELVSGFITYDYNSNRYSGNYNENYESDIHSVNIGTNYDISAFSPNTILKLNFGYENYVYTRDNVILYNTNTDLTTTVDNLTITMGGEKSLSEKIHMDAHVGYRDTHSEYKTDFSSALDILDSLEKSDETGFTGSFHIEYIEKYIQHHLTIYHRLKDEPKYNTVVNSTFIKYNTSWIATPDIRCGLDIGYTLSKGTKNASIDEQSNFYKIYGKYDFCDIFYAKINYAHQFLDDKIDRTYTYRNKVYLQVGVDWDIF